MQRWASTSAAVSFHSTSSRWRSRSPSRGIVERRRLQMGHDPLRRRLVEEVAAVLQASGEPVGPFGHGQRQVELRRPGVERDGGHRHTAQPQRRRTALEVEHDPEERMPPRVARRLQLPHQPLEGHLLVRRRTEHHLAHPLEQLDEARIPGEVGAQRHRVDEESDHLLELGAGPSGDRCSDGDVARPAVPREQRRECREQRHEQGAAVRTRQCSQRTGELGADPELQGRPPIRRLGGAGTVDRQVEVVGGSGEPVTPVRQLSLEHVAAERAALPHRDVGVLHRRRGEVGGPSLDEIGVPAPDLLLDEGEGPQVEHDVVDDPDEHVVLRIEAEQECPLQRSALQVEGPASLLGGEPPRLRLPAVQRQPAEIDDLEAHRLRRHDLLHGHAVARREAGSQRLVALHHPTQGALQGVDVQAAPEAVGEGDAVDGAGRRHRLQEPHPLLAERQRQRPLPIARRRRHDGDGTVLRRRGDGRREPSHRRGREQRAHRDLDPETVADPGRRPGGEQRMTAESEEVVVDPDAVDRQRLLEDGDQDLLDRGPGRSRRGRRAGTVPGGGERGAVDLPVRRQRKSVEDGDERGHHDLGQDPPQVGPQLAVRRRPALGDDVRHQPALAGTVLARDHHRLADARMGRERSLDLAALDAVATDLHLVVEPPEELEVPVGPVPHPVARAVEPRAGSTAERVGDEAVGGELGPVEVPAGQAHPRNAQLARHPHRHRLEPLVDDVRPRVRDRAPDRRRVHVVSLLPGRHRRGGGDDGVLGGAVVVDEAEPVARRGTAAQAVAPGQEEAERRSGRLTVREDLLGHGGRQEAHGDPPLAQPRPQPPRGAAHLLLRDPDARSCRQVWPQLPDRGVEANRGQVGRPILRTHRVGAPVPRHQVQKPAVLDHHTLRRAGGSRGVDDVGEVLRTRPGRRRLVRMGRDPWPLRVQAHGHRAPGVADAIEQRRLGEEHRRRAVLDHGCQPLRGMVGIERHVGAAGPQDAEQPDHHLR